MNNVSLCHPSNFKNTVIRRRDIEKVHDWVRDRYVDAQKLSREQMLIALRDYMLIRLPMKIGLRNSEIRMLRIEDINFEDRSFEVLDSKKYERFPLPLDVLTLQLIQDLVGTRREGFVFQHVASWTHVKADQPLSRVQIWNIIHDIAEKAGVKGFNPRLLRHYFACHWIYVEKKNVVTLQRLLRHSDLSVTFFYTKALSFFEDDQDEYDGVRSDAFQEVEESAKIPLQNQIAGPNLVSLEDSICKVCSNLFLCKFAPLPLCVTSCRFKVVKPIGISQYH